MSPHDLNVLFFRMTKFPTHSKLYFNFNSDKNKPKTIYDFNYYYRHAYCLPIYTSTMRISYYIEMWGKLNKVPYNFSLLHTFDFCQAIISFKRPLTLDYSLKALLSPILLSHTLCIQWFIAQIGTTNRYRGILK